MRFVAAAGLLLLQLSAAMVWFFQPARTAAFDRWIPQDILGLLVVTDAPPNLDFLEHTRLSSWLDLDAQKIRERIPDEMGEDIVSLFQRDLESVWFFVHHLSRKSDGALRLHFTALLVPRPLHSEALKLRIELAVMNFFGASETSVFEQDMIRIYQGSRPGQILYVVELPHAILISNSEEGWQKTLRATTGKDPSLAESSSFQRVKNHLPIDSGLFVYVRAGTVVPFFPEFGYLIRWGGGRVADEYYQVDKP